MARLHTSFILGYHGCRAEVGEKVLAGDVPLAGSEEEYDWLGPGVYFWEADPKRAWEWAHWKVSRGAYSKPCVVGAVIDLGNCLDLMARESLQTLSGAYASLKAVAEAADDDRMLPKNKRVGDHDKDHLLRFLDCAVIRHLHAALDEADEPPFDSVRGLFTEGAELFPGSGFKEKTHVQVAVTNPELIKGYFRVEDPS